MGIKVTEMSEATSVNDDDLLMIVQNDENKKITKKNLQAGITDKTLTGRVNTLEGKVTTLETDSTDLKSQTKTLNNQVELLQKLMPKVQGTGNIVSLNNTADAPFYNFQLLGDTIQDGTPSIDAPVFVNSVGSNINYFDVTKMVYDTSTNLQKQDNKYVGTSIQNILLGVSSNSAPQIEQNLEAGDYTISYNIYSNKKINVTNVYLCVIYTDDTTENIKNDKALSIALNTITKVRWNIKVPKKVKKIGIVSYLSDTATVRISNIKLEKGKTATTISEYNQASTKAIITNKNVLGYYNVNPYQNIFGATLTASIGRLSPNTTYTLSFNSNEAGNQYYLNESIFATPPRITTQKGLNKVTAKTKDSLFFDTSLVILLKNAKVQPNAISIIHPQVEVGSEATDYVSHIENNFDFTFKNLELSKIGDYQDRIYKENGKWYKEEKIKKLIFDGDEDFVISNSSTDDILVVAYNGVNLLSGYGKCSHFALADEIKDSNCMTYNKNWSLRFCIDKTKCATIDDFKTWLSNNNVIFYGININTQKIEITDATLINQLNAISNSSSFENNTVATLYNDIGEIKIAAYKLST